MKRAVSAFIAAILTAACATQASAQLRLPREAAPMQWPDTATSEQAYVQTGKGWKTLDGVFAGTSLAAAHITHLGKSSFSVWQTMSDGSRHLLVSTVGAYDGIVTIDALSPSTLDISADGDWRVIIEPVFAISADAFAGSGDYVTGIFTAPASRWDVKHYGQRAFSVWQYAYDGSAFQPLASSIGDFDGISAGLPAGTPCYLVIKADGDWSVTPA